MKMKHSTFFFPIIFSMLFFQLNPAIKGSETVLSVEPFYTFLSEDNDNSMLGFGWFKNGFALEDSSTSCTFDSVFPVSGNIYLNGGNFYLNTDVFFRNVTTWHTSGNIYGNNFFVDLSSSITSLGETTYDQVFDNARLDLNSDLVISGSVKLQGNCIFNGNSKRVTLNDDGYLIIDYGATVTLKDIYIEGITSGKIICLDDSSTLVLDDVYWSQDGDYSFTVGKIVFENDVCFDGAHTFLYESSQTSTIQKNSSWSIKGDMRIEIGRKEAVDYVEPLCFVDETSVLKLSSCTFVVTDSGMSLTKGTFRISHDVMLEINSTTSSNGLIFGNGVADDDLSVDIYPGAALHLVKGHLVAQEADTNFLSLNHGNARIIRGANSTLFVNQDIIISNLIIDTDSASSMIVEAGKNMSYNNCDMLTAYADFLLTGIRGGDYANFLMGNGDIFLKKGTLPVYTYIWNTNNTIRGNGNIGGAVVLQNSGAQVQFSLNGDILTDISMNGGTISLAKDLHLTQDKMFIGHGSVNLGSKSVYFGSQDKTWTGSVYWDGNVGRVHMNSKVSLSGTWTFNGTCVIDGRGNTLELNSVGQIVVEPDSSLTLKDIRIEGVSGNNIRCMSDTSCLRLCNVNWLQDSDYSFTTGALGFEDEVNFSGAYTFSYQSNQTSTILKNSRWAVTNNMKLSIGRFEAVDSIEPLYFEDETATLKINNGTFFVTDSGMRLTRGTFSISHDVMLEINSTCSNNGLVFGDGLIDNDLKIDIYPGAALHCVKGDLVIDEVDTDIFSLNHGNARVIRQAGSTFYVNQDLTISNLIINNAIGSSMIVEDGKSISYNNCFMETVFADFTLTGQRGNDYVNFLMGSGDLFIHKGTLPAYTYIWGAGNTIRGNGSISGVIALQNSSAECSFGINGCISNNIIMNGGKITLEDDLCLANNKVLIGSGTVGLASHSLYLGVMDKVWAGTTYWDGSGGYLHINSMLSLSGKWTFSGTCVVHGHLNILELGPSAEIIVERGSTLIFKEVKIKDLANYNIRCLGPDSSILYDNCKVRMNGNYTFTQGSFVVNELLEVHGNSTNDTFIYQSAQQSMIYPCSSLRMYEGTTLSYDPSVALRDRIGFTNIKSKLELDGATLHSTATGFQMLKGTLEIKGDSYFASDATIKSEGITFGDGILAANDFDVDVLPNADVEITSGYVVDKNVE